MSKKSVLIAALMSASLTAFAGGYVTNTNQSVLFLRQPARNAMIGVQGAYFNPAGVGFMDKGFQLAFDVQNVTQKRINTTTYAPLRYGVDNSTSTKEFVGTSYVPVLPHFDLSYTADKWFASFHFGVISGGGKAEYDNGLASFETPIAMIPGLINTLAGGEIITGYDVDTQLVGEQYNFAGQLNLGYKFNSHWSVAAGLRLNYIYNKYDGSLSNVKLEYGGALADASTVLGAMISQMSGGAIDAATAAAMSGAIVGDREIRATQKDIAYTPVLSVNYAAGKFNLAARYEFRTKVRLENDTEVNTTGISTYDADVKPAADIPAILALGADYNVKDNLRLSFGFNYYFDKSAKTYNSATGLNDKQDLLKHNSFEFLGGVEWDITDIFTVSCGAHSTTFGFGDDAEFISDLSFNTSSASVGLGAQMRVSPKVALDLAVYKTFYTRFTKHQTEDYGGVGATYEKALTQLASSSALIGQMFSNFNADALKLPGKDEFYRKSFVVGLGVTVDF